MSQRDWTPARQDMARRVKTAAATFTTAADHYGRNERADVAMLLACQVEGADDSELAAFDLTAAGAIAIGFVLSDRRCDIGCRVDAQDDLVVFTFAEDAVNAAAGDEWDRMNRVLNAAFDELTGEQLRTLVMLLVAVYSKVSAS